MGYWWVVWGTTCRCHWPDRCILEFTCRFIEKLESPGDTTMSAKQHSGAISHYPPSLKPAMLRNLLIKRSKAYMTKGLLMESLNDAKKVRYFVLWRFAFVNRSLPGVRAWFTVCMRLCMPHHCNKRTLHTGRWPWSPDDADRWALL